MLQGVPRPVERLTPGAAGQTLLGNVSLELGQKKVFSIKPIQQLPQPIEQKIIELVTGQRDVHAPVEANAGQVGNNRLEQRLGRFNKQRVQVGGGDTQAQVGRVFECFVHENMVPHHSPST